MSTKESRAEILTIIAHRLFRDTYVARALTLGIIDQEQACDMKRCDDLPQVVSAITDAAIQFAAARDISEEMFETMMLAILGGTPSTT